MASNKGARQDWNVLAARAPHFKEARMRRGGEAGSAGEDRPPAVTPGPPAPHTWRRNQALRPHLCNPSPRWKGARACAEAQRRGQPLGRGLLPQVQGRKSLTRAQAGSQGVGHARQPWLYRALPSYSLSQTGPHTGQPGPDLGARTPVHTGREQGQNTPRTSTDPVVMALQVHTSSCRAHFSDGKTETHPEQPRPGSRRCPH